MIASAGTISFLMNFDILAAYSKYWALYGGNTIASVI